MGEGGQTHYEILGIGRQSSAELVRQAYRRLAQKYHPDRLPGSNDAQQRMARINDAYAVLSDPQGRAAYDRWVDAREGLITAERAVAQAAQGSYFSASWPWFLLAGTLAFILVSVGTVLYKELVPAMAPSPAPLSAKAAPPPALHPRLQSGPAPLGRLQAAPPASEPTGR